MKPSTFLMAVFMMLCTFAQAQKIGHINSGNLIASLPETAVADTLLMQLRDSLVNIGEDKATTFEKRYKEFVTNVKSGTLTPKQQGDEQAALEKMQQELQAMEETIVNAIEKRRGELFDPILDRVEAAIKSVGKANGYQFILDSSVFNALLFVQEQDDVTAMVTEALKKK